RTAEPELGDKIHQVSIVGVPVMIKSLEASIADPEGASKAARLRLRLDDGRAKAALGEFIAGGKPGEASPNDHDAGEARRIGRGRSVAYFSHRWGALARSSARPERVDPEAPDRA